ncbi:GNAT family N-acetyltransferase [Acaricomes phytoseiuli]|uniref:GNAT family N-acetyltransferase n=1 Tax=Acaricomes phytoseiuli TaxID=291968 RepID=UPI000380189F|nr:N-acetyltransferase [Acaricomes phytoseiuli]MCW1250407.1 GNAT family N-acetyltransferase [Acaricomes phytoseiuli]
MTSSPQLVFRRARPQDYPEVARITRESYLQAGHFDSADHPYVRKIQEVAERAQQAEIWVAEQLLDSGPVLVGAVTLAQHGEPYAEIAQPGELEVRMLVVDPQRQGAGIGRAMMRAIIDDARGRPGLHAVSLTTGETWLVAHALYRSLGFQRQVERDWLVPGEDDAAAADSEHYEVPDERRLRVYRLAL